jgi:sulfane dehydrogenase subunit SoxC
MRKNRDNKNRDNKSLESKEQRSDHAAGNGLLSRRVFLEGALLAGAAGSTAGSTASSAEPLAVPRWMTAPGAQFSGYGQPSRFEAKVVRGIAPAPNPATEGSAPRARRPAPQRHDHAERAAFRPQPFRHARHRSRPASPRDPRLGEAALVFTLEALSRYPMQSRISFIECAGNSARSMLRSAAAQRAGDSRPHLLRGMDRRASRDAARRSRRRSVGRMGSGRRRRCRRHEPQRAAGKCMDDALVCLYQNGERVRPSNGYPIRLLLPGFEGNMNVKWLRRLKLVEAPAMTKDETSKYTILLKDGKAWQFVFPMEVKSVITQPSPGLTLKGPGFYEISGLAWSGNGRIRQVEVSADGGMSFAPAVLQEPVLLKAVTRFRAAWQWNGGPAVLQSRATDETGMVQPTRATFVAERGLRSQYHYNAIASWRIDEKEATNALA